MILILKSDKYRQETLYLLFSTNKYLLKKVHLAFISNLYNVLFIWKQKKQTNSPFTRHTFITYKQSIIIQLHFQHR